MGLESVLGWFGEIAGWIINLIPRVAFPHWREVLVLWEFQTDPKLLTRPFIYIPAWSSIARVVTLPGLRDIDGQVVTLSDGQEMYIDVAAEVEIVDVRKYAVEYADEELAGMAIMSAVRYTLAAYSLKEYIESEADLEEDILEACCDTEARYGLAVKRVYITSAAKCRTIRLVND